MFKDENDSAVLQHFDQLYVIFTTFDVTTIYLAYPIKY